MDIRPVGPLQSAPCIKRHPGNPLLSPPDTPYPVALTFNAGVTKYEGRYVMVFRADRGSYAERRIEPFKTVLGLAFSKDGVAWQVGPGPCFSWCDDEVRRVYDPRLTVIDGRCYMCFAIDTFHGTCGGIAVTDDFEKFQVLTVTCAENRNIVLFPEKKDGTYVRLERPFHWPGFGSHIWMSRSPDLRYWGDNSLLLPFELIPFANFKIGPAAPPVKTKWGWLTTFHAVDQVDDQDLGAWDAVWRRRYTAGIMLLDLNNPAKVIGLSREPLLAPEASYETQGGYRNHVIFPGGMILEDSGEAKIYYGAADTHECLATAHVDDLLALCKPV